MSAPARRRLRLRPLPVAAVLAIALLRPDAWASPGPPTTSTTAGPGSTTTTIPGDGSPTPVEPGPSTDADVTWGTGVMADGTAQRVLALTVVGRRVYLAGDFTAMTPPGAKPMIPTTTTTTTASTTTTPSGSTSVQPRAMTATALSSPPTMNPAPRDWLAPPVPTDPPGVARHHLAALDVDKHTLLAWDPDADGTVHALAVSADGTQLYIGGDFDHIGGMAASRLARIDLATGDLDPTFHPGVRGSVRALALAGDRLYVGGTFTTVAGPDGGESRPKLAALDAATGDLLPWTPPALGPGRFVSHNGVPMPNDAPGDVLALAITPVDGLVYAGGTFLDLGGQSALAVLDPVTAHIVPEQWGIRRPVFDLAVSPDDGETVFASAGGSGGQVYAVRSDTPKQPVWSTWVDGDAPGVAASDTHVYLMGHYDYAGPDNQLRHHLAAFNADNGAVDGWNPTANTPYGAFAAAVGADHVFVGGAFSRINGHPQPGFAQFPIPR